MGRTIGYSKRKEVDTMATKQEEKRKAALAAATDLFDSMTQEQANAYFTENLMITQITKAHMAAYIKKYATKKDQEWIKKDFKKASYKTVKKQVNTVCTDESGIPLHKVDKKTGKVVPVVKRVNSITGETIERFDLAGARKEFVSHFGITPKENKFTAKAKRTEAVFDEFADIF